MVLSPLAWAGKSVHLSHCREGASPFLGSYKNPEAHSRDLAFSPGWGQPLFVAFCCLVRLWLLAVSQHTGFISLGGQKGFSREPGFVKRPCLHPGGLLASRLQTGLAAVSFLGPCGQVGSSYHHRHSRTHTCSQAGETELLPSWVIFHLHLKATTSILPLGDNPAKSPLPWPGTPKLLAQRTVERGYRMLSHRRNRCFFPPPKVGGLSE